MKRAVALACALGLTLAACSGDDDDDSRATKASDLAAQVVDLRDETTGEQYAAIDVSAKDNEFIPAAVRVQPGTTVTWTNEGRSAHDIVAENEDIGFGVGDEDFAVGDDYEFRFDKPGVYRYWCHLHGTDELGMVGLIVVGDVDVDDASSDTTTGTAEGTLNVPDDYPTIQGAVDAAAAGSLILVAPGTYKEEVTVTTDDVVIRGLDRNETILDGEFTRENGFKVLADGVAIENLTAQNFTLNGFFWTGVVGYRGSYINAIRNGDYGIYAFDSVKGQFDHAYASGSPDAGFYIGQCFPCDAVITDVIAEWNGIGYSGTNAGGNLIIVNSTWRENRVGIVPNSGTGEANPPQRESVIAGNRVYSNNNELTSAIDIAETASYNGILLAGANDNIVIRNLVYDHDLVGIAPVTLPEKVLNPDNENALNFDARGNEIRENVLRDNRAADLGVVTSIDDASDGGDNCFSDNEFTTSLPADIETVLPCDAPASTTFTTDIPRFLSLLGGEKPPSADYKTVPLPDPGAQPEMPDAKTAKPRPASSGVPIKVDIEKVTLPQ